MTLDEMLQVGPKISGAIWYALTTYICHTLVPRFGPDFAAGFEAALMLVHDHGIPSDLDDLFQQREDDRGL